MLLASRINVPPPQPGLVARRSLLAQLDVAVQRVITLVAAPPGAGKTALLAEWARLHNTAWLSLEADCNDPTTFWKYLIGALRGCLPEIGVAATALLGTPNVALEAALVALLNDLAKLGQPVTLILDDYQAIEHHAVHESLAFVIDHLQPVCRVVLASRSQPPLPLARWRAHSMLSEIEPNALRLAPTEVEAIVGRGRGLAESEIAAIDKHIEGWAAGAHLLSLALQQRAELAPLLRGLGSHRFVFDYLCQEIFDHETPSMQTWLLQTSLLDSLCDALCHAVLEDVDSKITLAEIANNNLFLMPLDDERNWFRFHPLFAQAMQVQLRRREPDRATEIYRRASIWHERRGDFEAAIRYALAGQHFDRAAMLIEGVGGALLVSGGWEKLNDWCTALPEAVLNEHVQVSLFYAWALTLAGKIEAGQAQLARVDRHFEPTISSELRGQAQALQGTIAAFRGDTVAAIAHSQAALALLPPQASALRGIVAANLGSIYTLNGQLHEAREALGLAQTLSNQVGNRATALAAADTLAQIAEECGDISDAVGLYTVVTAQAETAPHLGVTAACGLSRIAYEQNQLDESLAYARRALDAAKRIRLPELLALSQVTLARALSAQNAQAEAQALLDDTAAQLARVQNPLVGPFLSALHAELLLHLGNFTSACTWAERHVPPAGEALPAFFAPLTRRSEIFAYARVQIALGRGKEVEPLLQAVYQLARSAGRSRSEAEALVLLACAGDTKEALFRALELAAPMKLTRMFVDAGPAMQRLLAQHGTHRYVAQLRLLPSTTSIPALQPLAEPLTERELEIVRLIAAGASNREIAAQLIISLGTVKKHLNNIFGKLEANSRTQAVARARSLALV